MEAAAVHAEHHGPPPANQSSRVLPQFLGMYLFIISEVMVFGAFFTAYFFIRVVVGAHWPAQGTELPKLIAGVNTCILVSSSFTIHWALECARKGNRFGLQAGMLTPPHPMVEGLEERDYYLGSVSEATATQKSWVDEHHVKATEEVPS